MTILGETGPGTLGLKAEGPPPTPGGGGRRGLSGEIGEGLLYLPGEAGENCEGLSGENVPGGGENEEGRYNILAPGLGGHGLGDLSKCGGGPGPGPGYLCIGEGCLGRYDGGR